MSECKKLKRDFNESTQSHLEDASGIQVDLENLSKRMNEKLFQVLEEFATLKIPLYSRRHALLRSVPRFWATAFMNHPKLKLLTNNAIEDCFHYLQSIEIENELLTTGYQIVFVFDAANPYFYNNKLVKTCTCSGAMGKVDIDWKDNMNLSECSASGRTKTSAHHRKLTPPLENLFDWLQRASPCNDIIGDIIKDDLWVDPFKYYFHQLEESNEDKDKDNSESESNEDDDADEYEVEGMLDNKTSSSGIDQMQSDIDGDADGAEQEQVYNN